MLRDTFAGSAHVVIPNCTEKELFIAIDNNLCQYNNAGFTIKTIHADCEFKPLFEQVCDNLDVTMNYPPAQAHVPEAERNIKTLKERICIGFFRLPYKAIPSIMINRLVLESAFRLNLFPAKGGVSSYYSLQVIPHRTVIEYSKHCAIPFGAYVQAADENTIKKCTNQAIYLRPLRNQQGGDELFHLHSGKTITRHDITPILISDTIIWMIRHSNVRVASTEHWLLYDTRSNATATWMT